MSSERWLGMIFTSIGIGLLLLVFYLAYQMLTHPVPGLEQALAPTSAAAGGTVNSVGKVGSSIAAFLLKLAVLFVMTLAGSNIASRGIQLYHGGVHASTGIKPTPVSTAVISASVPAESPSNAESAERQ